MKRLIIGTALLFALPLPAATPSPAIQAAVADSGRPAADKARDAARHPAETLAFAGVKPGQKVADFIMGGGYFTRLLAGAVGDKGKVYAFQPAEFIKFRPAYAEEQKAASAPYANVVPVTTSFGAVAFAEPLDLIITVQNYHDMHITQVPADTARTVDAALFAALKPGGILVVIDHTAAAGSGLRDASTLHRIDPAAVRVELEAAGFTYDGTSDLLRAPADPLTKNVFDPAIRGKTDQFMLRFRKPK
jgi:predicted methyltransferase